MAFHDTNPTGPKETNKIPLPAGTPVRGTPSPLKTSHFGPEIRAAVKRFEQCVLTDGRVVPTTETQERLERLVAKAISAYETRPPHLRHGMALDGENGITVILSQTADPSQRPLCGVYQNLSTPYATKPRPQAKA